MIAVWLLLPFAVHAGATLVDEFVFHYRRGLPRWERIGHPLDALTALFCLAWVFFAPINGTTVTVYVAAAVFSCLFVTKDEWVHTRQCSAGEHWLHGILFLCHSLVLVAAGLIWPALHGEAFLWGAASEAERQILQAGFIGFMSLGFVFFLYETVYWNWFWKGSVRELRHQ